MGFGVVPRRLDAGVVLAVRGELDVQTAPCFDAAVSDALASDAPTPGARHLVVDLAGTTFVDSSACRALVLAARACAAAGAGFEVVCPVENRPVRRVLTLVGFEALTPLRQSLAETPLAGDLHPGGREQADGPRRLPGGPA